MYKKLLKSELNNEHLKGKAIVAFRATWCPPCQMIGPELKQISENSNDINVFDFDVDQNREFAHEMGVSSIPSLFIYQNGQFVQKTTGYLPADELKKLFK
ncbi:thioredoxin family protein [Metamycoplasma equirhinis]|uniref:Thioredoxin family protein n=1 Tax=Metamycoplasma equirhinis TaxID=92402 RepID=A0ABZ0PAN8_9BACT|nr:thioredoxin family protein [Metamycoplasma equirhinis]TPD98847.1 thioredoxin family protein [Metamycoplasma equirhinis]WPB54013.1 thioredoxin family protein [Metamycoplasma equirhinis]BDX52448.1 thioredoxin [Metamycoplasma equirhinis]